MKILVEVGPMSDPFDLSGRLAVVTGAKRGIGFAIAEALAAAGRRHHRRLGDARPDVVGHRLTGCASSGASSTDTGSTSPTGRR